MLIPRLVLAATVAASASLSAQIANAPCFEPEFGTFLGRGFDVVFPAVPLGFPFAFGGHTWTDIEIAENGFVWLGANGNTNSRDGLVTSAQFVQDPASIAILWTNIRTNPNGGVYYNALPGRAVITWFNVQVNWNAYITLQMQITAANEVTFWYDPATSIPPTMIDAIAGITIGSGAVDPGSTDLSASFPINTNHNPTLYEHWPSGTFDLAGRTWEILENGGNGWVGFDRSGCRFWRGKATEYGHGCPGGADNPVAQFGEFFSPANSFDLTGYEMVPIGAAGYRVQPTTAKWFNGYRQPTNLGNDEAVTVDLPFSFPTPAGTVTSVGLCSNGYLSLSPERYVESTPWPHLITDGPPRIYGALYDWNRPGAGQIWSDPIDATSWAFTWDGVAAFSGNTPAGTWQMQIGATGRVVLLYRDMQLRHDHNLMTGFASNIRVPYVPNTDLSAAMPFRTGTGEHPIFLGGYWFNPAIGRTYHMEVWQQPASAIGAILSLGFRRQNARLDSLGMPGCMLYTSMDASWLVPATQPSTSFNLSLPSQAAFIGYSFFAQAFELAPDINAVGVVSSNGLRLTVGSY